jgi:tetratricopeptide (TPR) repeat protein
VRVRPQHHKAHTLLARDFLDAGDTDKVIEHASAALAVEPTLFAPNMYLGHAYSDLADYDQAAKHYGAASAAESADYSTDRELRRTLEAMGAFVDATHLLNSAENDGDEQALAHGRIGMALLMLGRFEPAVREFEIALAAGPGPLEERVAYAIALGELGRFDDALATAREARALAGDEDNAPLMRQLDEMIGAFQSERSYRPAPRP